tara:strand:- start:292 stop:579 length:288 start_codon:yes stop_codon:yes gene_type:complete
MNKTLTKSKIIENLHFSVGLSRSECSFFLETFISKVLESLKNGEDVKIANFGTFNIKSKSPRIGRNPKTKIEVMISSRSVIKFKPSSYLISKINK